MTIFGGGILLKVLQTILKPKKVPSTGKAEGGPTREEDDDPEVPIPQPGHDDDPDGIPKPIAVGFKSDPKVAGLLGEMNAYFASHGIDTAKISAEELTRMPKAPGQPFAIPPRWTWKRMLYTLQHIVQPLRNELGVPMSYRAYRPPDYNEAVGGAENSRHIYFEGVDVRIVKDHNTPENRRRLAMTAARMYVRKGKSLKMGLGVYGGSPTPSHIHVDAGFRHRHWNDAGYYVKRAKSIA